MKDTKRITKAAGLAAVIAGVALIGTSGITFAVGWGLWLAGLVLVLGAVGRPVEAATVTTLTPALEPVVGEQRAA